VRTDSFRGALILGAHQLQSDKLAASLDLSESIALAFNAYAERAPKDLLKCKQLLTFAAHSTSAQNVGDARLAQACVIEALGIIVPGLLVNTDLRVNTWGKIAY
jgi:hypothetical protein